jgi:hypothetical protein
VPAAAVRRRSGEAVAEGGRLDLHEGIPTSDPRTGCKRWPEHLWLLNGTTGQVTAGRCRSTNLCAYCAKLFAVETSEMLLLDAMEDAPTIYVVLTARAHLTRAQATVELQHLRRVLRGEWSNIRWAVTVEFQRRGALHLNLLVKGVPVEDHERLHDAVTSVWCSRVDAAKRAQWSGVIADELGVVKYLSLHFLKASQAPAIGWRGHRYSSTRDYLVRPASVMREEAKRSLRLKRKLWHGVSLEVAAHELQRDAEVRWSLRHDPSKPVPAAQRYRDTGRRVEIQRRSGDVHARELRESILHGEPTTAEVQRNPR